MFVRPGHIGRIGASGRRFISGGALIASVAGIGDSVLAGQYANGHTAIGQMGLGSGVTVLNTGVPGEALKDSLNRVTYGSIESARSTTMQAVAIIQGGTNDLADNGGSLTAVRLYEGVTKFLVNTAKAQGFYVIVATLLPRKLGVFNWSTAQEAERVSYNNKVRANTAGADYIMDLAAHPVMGDAANNTSNTTYYYDGVHPTDVGQDQLAPTYAAAVQAVLAGNSAIRLTTPEIGVYARLTGLSNMTETGNGTVGYTYQSTTDAGYGSTAGVGIATTSLPALTVGWFEIEVPSFGTQGPLFGLQTSSAFTNYTSITDGAYIDSGQTSDSPTILVNGAPIATANGNKFLPAAGDKLRIRRAEGGTYAEISRDGALWTQLHSFDGNGAQFYMGAMSPNTQANASVLRPRSSLTAT